MQKVTQDLMVPLGLEFFESEFQLDERTYHRLRVLSPAVSLLAVSAEATDWTTLEVIFMSGCRSIDRATWWRLHCCSCAVNRVPQCTGNSVWNLSLTLTLLPLQNTPTPRTPKEVLWTRRGLPVCTLFGFSQSHHTAFWLPLRASCSNDK